jgi:hypothetical protein
MFPTGFVNALVAGPYIPCSMSLFRSLCDRGRQDDLILIYQVAVSISDDDIILAGLNRGDE